MARVKIVPRTYCHACEQGNGCGAGLLTRLLRPADQQLDIRLPAGVKPGQQIWLSISESRINSLAWCWYGWPLAGLLCGAALFALIPAADVANDILSGIGAALGLMAGILMATRHARRTRNLLQPEAHLRCPTG